MTGIVRCQEKVEDGQSGINVLIGDVCSPDMRGKVGSEGRGKGVRIVNSLDLCRGRLL